MSIDLEETFQRLFDRDNNAAYEALKILQKESEETDAVYSYMDQLSDMLDSENSYIRTRGLTLIAYNAKWDRDYKIDEMIDQFLHIGKIIFNSELADKNEQQALFFDTCAFMYNDADIFNKQLINAFIDDVLPTPLKTENHVLDVTMDFDFIDSIIPA